MIIQLRHLNLLILSVLLGCIGGSVFGNQRLGKYQLILDKEVFGRKPQVTPKPRPTPAPPPISAKWADEYVMTMIAEEENGLARIGLQHTRDNSALLLVEGDTRFNDPYVVENVDFSQMTARVRYQGVTHQFSLQDGPASRPASTSESRTPRPTNGIRQSSSTHNRFQRRQTVVNATPTPVPTPRFKSREELEAHLKNVQMDAIRTGKPPLPIPLTPAMDQQLVKEGVLPPQ